MFADCSAGLRLVDLIALQEMFVDNTFMMYLDTLYIEIEIKK